MELCVCLMFGMYNFLYLIVNAFRCVTIIYTFICKAEILSTNHLYIIFFYTPDMYSLMMATL